MNDYILKQLHLDYVKSFKKSSEVDPVHLEKINRLREYLDSQGIMMPKPKWKYCNEDKSTWHILPGRIVRDINGVAIRHKPYINDEFKFMSYLSNVPRRTF